MEMEEETKKQYIWIYHLRIGGFNAPNWKTWKETLNLSYDIHLYLSVYAYGETRIMETTKYWLLTQRT